MLLGKLKIIISKKQTYNKQYILLLETRTQIYSFICVALY